MERQGKDNKREGKEGWGASCGRSRDLAAAVIVAAVLCAPPRARCSDTRITFAVVFAFYFIKPLQRRGQRG